jgi:hypothetical protein
LTIQRNWQINVRENRRGNQKWTIQRNWQINVRENRRGNQKWTIQRNWQINVSENEGAIKNGQSRETGK